MFLSVEGLVKLSGYGLGEHLNPFHSTKSTAWCMAPEVFKEQREQKSDVWSLGISLMELAEGRNPFEGCNQEEVKQRVCEGAFPSLAVMEWSSAFVDFVSNCLVRDVEERWSVEQLMEVSGLSED